MSLLFASSGQSIRASVSTLVLPVNIQGWFPLGWTGLISLQSLGLPIVFPLPQAHLPPLLRIHVFLGNSFYPFRLCSVTPSLTLTLPKTYRRLMPRTLKKFFSHQALTSHCPKAASYSTYLLNEVFPDGFFFFFFWLSHRDL